MTGLVHDYVERGSGCGHAGATDDEVFLLVPERAGLGLMDVHFVLGIFARSEPVREYDLAHPEALTFSTEGGKRRAIQMGKLDPFCHRVPFVECSNLRQYTST